MIIEKPAYEKWEEIEKKYDGFCVFLANCIGDILIPEGGEVWGYDKNLGKLTRDVCHFIESDEYNLGVYAFKTLTSFDNTGGILQVVTLND